MKQAGLLKYKFFSPKHINFNFPTHNVFYKNVENEKKIDLTSKKLKDIIMFATPNPLKL
jgi:hypothetical protein